MKHAVTCRRTGRQRWRMAAAAVIALSGCSAAGGNAEHEPAASVTDVGVTLHDPVWSTRTGALVAFTDDHRVAAIRQGEGAVSTSEPLSHGRNLQISTADQASVFIPQPEHNRVAVMDLSNLRITETLEAGPAPDYLTEDAGLRMLLALSADGTTVTPVEEHGRRALPERNVDGGTELIRGSDRGRAVEYHTFGPGGIDYYKGPSSPPEHRGTFGMNIGVATGDTAAVTRSYVAEPGGGVLYAIDSGPGHGLREIGRATVSAPIRYLGSDDNRVYAATDRDLTVFESASFTGYRDGVMRVLQTIDYRAELPMGRARSAPLSGLAVGADRVYLTLRGQPFMVSVAKPRL